MRLVILHYHIFKNAGSTIENILDHSFGARFSRMERPDPAAVIRNSELLEYLDAHPKLRAISSHQIRYPVTAAPGYFFFPICFLRDPLDRLRSYYDYFRQKPDPAQPLSDLANRCRLRDFAAGMIAGFSTFVRNPQVNFLACRGASHSPREADLAVAIRRIMATPFFGVVDCFDQSAIVGTQALRSTFPELDCESAPANVSRGMEGTLADRVADLREQCGEEIYRALRELTSLDQRLVDLARKEVLRRYSKRLERTAESATQSSQNSRTSVLFASSTAGAHPAIRNRFGLSLNNLWNRVNGELRPCSLFDSAFYLRKYPDVAAACVDPLRHYLQYGNAESRQPHPLFDPAFYLSHNPDVKESGADPLIHYLEKGAMEDRKPHALFEPAWYRMNGGAEARDAENPLLHFLKSGADAAQPHPLFDCSAYLEANPTVAERGMNPLVHYLERSAGYDRFAASVILTNSRAATHFTSASIVELDLDDVRLICFCLTANPGRPATHNREERRAIHATAVALAVYLGLKGSVAVAWEDDEGATQWIAEPQQLPFLRSVKLGQVCVQQESDAGLSGVLPVMDPYSAPCEDAHLRLAI